MTTKKKTVFIVDDDEFLVDMYSLKFREKGFDVDMSMDSTAALEKLKEGFVPDVVLLDIVMPKMDGFELLRKIREEKLVQNSVVIILTNLGQQEDIQKGKKLNADDYIIKAYLTPSEVVDKVSLLLEQKKK